MHTFDCIALHCIALHCIALHCIALHYITLHYITLHYIACIYTYVFHIYIYIYIHVFMWLYIYIYMCIYACVCICVINYLLIFSHKLNHHMSSVTSTEIYGKCAVGNHWEPRRSHDWWWRFSKHQDGHGDHGLPILAMENHHFTFLFTRINRIVHS